MNEPEAPRSVDAPEPAAEPEPAVGLSPTAAEPKGAEPEHGERPTFLFFGVVAAVSLILDVASKAWAEIVLSRRPFDSPSLVLIKDHLTLTIAYNKGGAWGLL